ncbi:MAG: arsenate reductase ArsC [Candidatus Kariarchaeaceae archaeon]|jgi:arsenate reductase
MKILFLCTHNSVRSQIAEGLVNYYIKNIKAFSAGTQKTQVHPLAIEVMKEVGIDISHHKSKLVDDFIFEEFDYVVTVCDSAKESCPFFPNAKALIHVGFEDPSRIMDEKEQIQAFRTTRERIHKWISLNFLP